MNKEKYEGRKIYVVGDDISYIRWINDIHLVDNIEEAEIVMFTGGADIHPSFYGDEVGMFTGTNINRDIKEFKLFKKCEGKLVVGICRGSQFLTVANGGKLIQDVSGHAIGGKHYFTTVEGKNYAIPSTHHQMMYPFNMSEDEYDLIAWSSNKLSITYKNGFNNEMVLPDNFKEPEIVWYPNGNSLAIQGHPEYCNDKVLHTYLNNLINIKYNEVYKKEPDLIE